MYDRRLWENTQESLLYEELKLYILTATLITNWNIELKEEYDYKNNMWI